MQDLVTKLTADNADLRKKLEESSAKVKELEAETKRLNATQKQNEQISRKMAGEYNKLSREALKYKKQVEGLAKNKINMNFKGLLTNISGITSALGGFGGLASLIGSTLSSLGGTIGLLANPMALIGASAIAGSAAFVKYNTELDRTIELTRLFTGLNGNSLVSLRNGVQSVATSFGLNFNTVLASVDNLMSLFGINGEEALNVIRDGFVAGANDGGKFLELLQRYGGAFNDAGILASELAAIIAQTRSGIFSEQGMEMISKGTQRIRLMSKVTADALKGIGVDTDAMLKNVNSGQMSTLLALLLVSAKLKELPPSALEVGVALKALFEEQGERNGYQLAAALADVSTNLLDVKGLTGEVGAAMLRFLLASRRLEDSLYSLFGVSNSGWQTMGTQIKTYVYEGISDVIDALVDLWNEFGIVRGAVAAVSASILTLWITAKTVVKAIAQLFAGLSDMIMGAFELDPSKITRGYDTIMKRMSATLELGIKDLVHTYNESGKLLDTKLEHFHSDDLGGSYGNTTNKTLKTTRTYTTKNTKDEKKIAELKRLQLTIQARLNSLLEDGNILTTEQLNNYRQLKEELDDITLQIQRLLGGSNFKFSMQAGSLADILNLISNYRWQIENLNLDDNALKDVLDRLQDALKKEYDLKVRLGLTLDGLGGNGTKLFDVDRIRRIWENAEADVNERLTFHQLMKNYKTYINSDNYRVAALDLMNAILEEIKAKESEINRLIGMTSKEIEAKFLEIQAIYSSPEYLNAKKKGLQVTVDYYERLIELKLRAALEEAELYAIDNNLDVKSLEFMSDEDLSKILPSADERDYIRLNIKAIEDYRQAVASLGMVYRLMLELDPKRREVQWAIDSNGNYLYNEDGSHVLNSLADLEKILREHLKNEYREYEDLQLYISDTRTNYYNTLYTNARGFYLTMQSISSAFESGNFADQIFAIGDAVMSLVNAFDLIKSAYAAVKGLTQTFDDLIHTQTNALELMFRLSNPTAIVSETTTLKENTKARAENNAVRISGALSSDGEAAARALAIGVIVGENAAIASNTAVTETNTDANVANAASNIFKAHSWIPWVGVAIAAASIASMIAIMSKFANGGIVGGSSYSGDHQVVRVNSGEMILNKLQLANLFKMINAGEGKGSISGDVNFRISGKDLVGCLDNYNGRQSKVL